MLAHATRRSCGQKAPCAIAHFRIVENLYIHVAAGCGFRSGFNFSVSRTPVEIDARDNHVRHIHIDRVHPGQALKNGVAMGIGITLLLLTTSCDNSARG